MEGIIEFNTGRYYSASGQRIAAMKVRGDVIFVDYDRMISGKIIGCSLTESAVMREYDKCNYEWIPLEMRHLEDELRETFA